MVSKSALLREPLDGYSVDILHGEPRHTVFGSAGVEHPRDVRVIETGQDVPLPYEAVDVLRVCENAGNDFDCGAPDMAVVIALGQVHRSHPAGSDAGENAIRPYPVEGQFVLRGKPASLAQKRGKRPSRVRNSFRVGAQQTLNPLPQSRPAYTVLFKKVATCAVFELASHIEEIP
jgi:hypothetical protein